MNYLAHAYLSFNLPDVLVGNMISDFVKGRNLHERFEPEVAKGIHLHRAIDEFTDSHPVVSQSKSRLRARYRHYAPVIVDIFYDHYLARNWNSHHALPLADFARQTYQTLEDRREQLPETVKQLLPYMTKGNWLVGYAQIEGIQRALTGMTRRTRFDSHMDEAVHELREFYDEFGTEFEVFFPDLKEYARTFLEGLED